MVNISQKNITSKKVNVNLCLPELSEKNWDMKMTCEWIHWNLWFQDSVNWFTYGFGKLILIDPNT